MARKFALPKFNIVKPKPSQFKPGIRRQQVSNKMPSSLVLPPQASSFQGFFPAGKGIGGRVSPAPIITPLIGDFTSDYVEYDSDSIITVNGPLSVTLATDAANNDGRNNLYRDYGAGGLNNDGVLNFTLKSTIDTHSVTGIMRFGFTDDYTTSSGNIWEHSMTIQNGGADLKHYVTAYDGDNLDFAQQVEASVSFPLSRWFDITIGTDDSHTISIYTDEFSTLLTTLSLSGVDFSYRYFLPVHISSGPTTVGFTITNAEWTGF